jgi:PST family polysaccharide transporter
MREGIHRVGAAAFQKIRGSVLAHNVIALFGTQIAAYAFPLATVPYLARVLGPSRWGLVAYSQAFALYISMVIDFGFQLSATRQVARARDHRGQVEQLVAGVMGAKAVLTFVCLVGVAALAPFLSAFRGNEIYLWAGTLSGVVQGFSFLWFYQGMERMKTSSGIDICGRAVATLAIFAFVRSRDDAWKVLAVQCVCNAGVTFSLLYLGARELRFSRPTLALTSRALRDSASMFLFRSAVSLYTTGNALILGTVAGPVAVGFYSGAERINKAFLGLLSPVSQAIYPRLSRLMSSDPSKSIALARISLGVMFGGSTIVAGVLYLASPVIVRVALGPGYERAIPVMRVLTILLPAIATSNVLGIQWMLPLGMDRIFNKIIISAGLLNLCLALWWARRWQEVGMASAVTVSECLVTFAMMIVLTKLRLSPLSDERNLRLEITGRMTATSV